MQIKISKTREQMLRAAIFEAFCTVSDSFLDTREEEPDLWSQKTKEIYDRLLDLEHEIEKEIFSRVFFPNGGNDEN